MIALCIAISALRRKHPRVLELDKIVLVDGQHRTSIEPGRIEIEHEGFSAIGLSVLCNEPYVIGNTEQTNFRLMVGPSCAALLLKDGDDRASVLPNGLTIQDATIKSSIVANGILPGLPLHVGNEPAKIEAKAPEQIEPLKLLAKLRPNPHGLRTHKPENEPTISA